MNRENVQQFARLVKEHRLQKKFTQQELAQSTGISLRSIQRIENAEVLPRQYTLNVLAGQLGFTFNPKPIATAQANDVKFNCNQKFVLSIGLGILLILLASAFVFQSPTFPESLFEMALYIAAVVTLYIIVLLAIWR